VGQSYGGPLEKGKKKIKIHYLIGKNPQRRPPLILQIHSDWQRIESAGPGNYKSGGLRKGFSGEAKLLKGGSVQRTGKEAKKFVHQFVQLGSDQPHEVFELKGGKRQVETPRKKKGIMAKGGGIGPKKSTIPIKKRSVEIEYT